MPNIFPDDFSKLEHRGWSQVAELYEQSWANLTKQFIVPLLETAEIKPGINVLDVACGPGYVAQSIYLKKALPTGIDFSGAMISVAKSNYPHLRFIEMDAQQLEFPDGSFDRIVMNFGMLHLAKPERAISEAYRTLKPGGRYAFTVWAGPENSPAARVMYESVVKYADPNIGLPEAPDSYLFSDKDYALQVLAANGFDPDGFSFRTQMVEWEVPTAEYLFDTEMKAGVRTAALLKRQSRETMAQIRQAVTLGMEKFYRDGAYHLQFCGCIVVAVKK